MKTKVCFTVDTELSMGGALEDPGCRPVPASRHVFCRSGNEEFGIPLIVRFLQRYGLHATFFVETLGTCCLGDADTQSTFEFLLHNQQDVQLHIHPVFHYYAELVKARAEGREYQVPGHTDILGHYPADIQQALLSEGIDYFQKFSGYRPVAFRAGCYAASRATLRGLASLGISVDSSLNPCYPELSFPGETLEPNLAQRIEGVWELPVTVVRTPLPEGGHGYKFADCSSLGVAEIRRMLDAAAQAGQEYFVIVFHSFSAAKPKDVEWREMRPNRLVIRRLEELFRYLAENSDRFQVSTMAAIAEELSMRRPEPGKVSPAVVADLGLLQASVRKVMQLVNNVYWV
ncbi:MAG TPA: hypothetical protein VKT29_10335 [Terriglobales bacterium]|nr:hypothetical protein [Terriglobales bacterium]